MRAFPALLIPLLVPASFFLPQPAPIEKQALPDVRIESLRSIGSGAHIGNGVILTAAHVVSDGGLIEVEDQEGNVYPASIIFSDDEKDVAAIQIETSPKIQSLTVGCRSPRIGEAIRTTGNPRGDAFISAWGRVAGAIRVVAKTVEVFPMDMTTIPGMSGGALQDWWGNVIGIVSMVMIQPPFGVPLHIGYAVPATTFCPLLKQHGVI